MWSANGFPIWFSGYRQQLRERGVHELRVVAMTYNAVWDYANGIVPNAPPELTIEIVSGGGRSNLVEDMDGEVIRMRFASELDSSKEGGAMHVQHAVRELSANRCATLVILYAGISRLAEMCDAARELRQRGADVALVGCGCELAQFMRTTGSLKRDGVTAVIFWGFTGFPPGTLPCRGGRDLLRDMVRATIARWTP